MNSTASRIVCAAALIVSAAAGASAQVPAVRTGAPPNNYANMTIRVDKLADNFYVLFGINGNGYSGSPIGVLTGPDGIFMVDASYPQLTDKIVAAIRTFSQAPIRFVADTHSHGEFSGGDPNFAKLGATIVARPEVRDQLAAQKGFDPKGLPGITYTQPLTFHMDGDDVVLIPVGSAHSTGDSMIYFRHADVLITGDFFRSGYPNVGGTVDGMITALGMAAGMCGPNTKVIPGHGPVSTRADLAAQKDLMVTVRDRVAALIKQGKSLEEVITARPTADFDAKYLNVIQYYDDANWPRFASADAFLKQVYDQLKSKS